MAFTRVHYFLQRIDYARQLAQRIESESRRALSWSDVAPIFIPDARQGGPLTEVIDFIGTSMRPTLNPRGEKDRDAVEHLLLRRLPFPSQNNCHVGDVVAFDSPYRFRDCQSILIRRIAAMPGDQMLSDVVNFEPFLIPDGFCWVLADNVKSEASEVVDSRFFGPLPLESIRGRIIYSAYDARDHGAVVNSPEVQRADEVLLKYELSIERLYSKKRNAL